MQQLAQRDIDYRIVYIHEQEFAERVRDIYISKQTSKRPPYFHEILEELVDMEAKFFIQKNREIFDDLSDEEVDNLANLVALEEPYAIQKVLERIDPKFVEMFARDLYLHLIVNQLAFYEKDFYENRHIREHNSPIQNIW